MSHQSGKTPPSSEKKKSKLGRFKNKFQQITGIPLELQRPMAGGTGGQKGREIDEMQDMMRKVYHIGHPACGNYYHNTGNCKQNPKCIKGLGENQSGIWKAEEGLGENPARSLRPEGKPYIGLRNLGATCYINSLLQSLFMNRRFRQAVYKWNGEDKLCKQLQLLFARLQNSRKDYCSPKEITNLLNIQTSVHQDVQEFNNLFMSLLTSKFKKSEDPEVQNFITNEFSGENRYETKCKRCGNVSGRNSQFNELELSIAGDKSNVSLNSCLKALIKEEQLSGDNKYDCENCGLENAVRRLQLVRLPPVLNIQLLRFVYDASSGTKKKLSTTVTFPRVLDMSSYLDKSGDRSDSVYQLSAVLLHLGKSASAGHYIAHIQDEATKQWWKFDDSSVTPLDSKEVGDIEVPQGFENERGTREKAKILISGLKKNPKVTSQNAYMLIYTRKDNRPIPDPVPPPEAAKYVEKANDILLSKLDEWKMKRASIRDAVETHKELYKQFMNLSRPVLHQPYHWIDAKWLSTWITGENTSPIDNKGILCSHGNVNPRAMPRLKIINSKAWQFLYDIVGGGGPELTGANLCFDCAADIYERSLLEEGKKNELQRIIQLAFRRIPTEGYWVPTRWLDKWKEYALMNELFALDPNICQSITCEHGNLTWKASERKLVCTEVWSFLRATFPEGPEYPKDTPPCEICKSISEQKIALMRKRKSQRAHERFLLPSLTKSIYHSGLITGTYNVIPVSWQKEWFHYITHTPVDSVEPPDITSLLCSHGKLKYDPVECIDYCINPKVFTRVIKHDEWKKIEEFYGKPKGEIRLDIVRDKPSDIPIVNAKPDYCKECIPLQAMQDTEDLMNYSSTKIWITVPVSSSLNAILNPFAGKSSQAHRFSMRVEITDTIHVLKLKIMQRINMQPINQELSYRGIVLENNQSVYDCRLIPGALVVLQKVKGKEGYEDGESNIVIPSPEIQTHSPKTNYVVEHGFAGSLLTGNDMDDDGEKKEEEPDEEWECPECTMLNTGSSCEVCDLPNPAIFGHQPPIKEEPLWECVYCHVPNEESNNRCIACEKLRNKH